MRLADTPVAEAVAKATASVPENASQAALQTAADTSKPGAAVAAEGASSSAEKVSAVVAENVSSLGTKEELILDFLPEKPSPSFSGLTEYTGVDPPLEALGLASWWPPGRVQYFLDMLHTSLDMPWCAVIFTTTLMIRVIVFPLVVFAQKNAAHLANNSPQMSILQERMTDARKRGDMYDSAVAGNDLKTFMDSNNIKPHRNVLPILGQLPFFMSMFLGLRGMANLPLESFTDGGMLWFKDLSSADPYYVLPLLTASTFALQLRLAADGASMEGLGKTMKYVMRGVPFVLFPLTMNFPAAITFYWFVTNVISVTQAQFCRMPAVRKVLGIPKLIKHSKKPQSKEEKGFKGLKSSFKESYDNFKVQAELIDRRAYDEQVFREVGAAKPKRTFKFDPTKSRKASRKFS